MKEKILFFLQQYQGEFVSGEELSKKLGVSRTAIWKSINQLKEEGYEIESISRKGYKLCNIPDLINEFTIKNNLNTCKLGKRIFCFETVSSTNDILKQKAADGLEEGALVVAEEQIKGKGRLGKPWVSEKKSGIWMSLLLRPKIPPMDTVKLTLLAGVAVCEAIRSATKLSVELKWPNDIVFNGKKICGILTEMSSELEQVNYVILGIGINVNTKSFPEEIQEVASSLRIERNQEYTRSKIIQEILYYFEGYYEKFLQNPSLEFVQEKMKEYSALMSKEVRVLYHREEKIGIVVDITKDGELIVQEQSGELLTIRSGEVSVRGIHGYV